MIFSSDFETTTDKNDCRVWAYAMCNIDDVSDITIGNSIDEFMKMCKMNHGSTHYFHNLKFDGEFIIAWLFENGYQWVKESSQLKTKTFTTLISDKGIFYSIQVCFYSNGKDRLQVKFLDSMKLLNMSVSEIANGFKLEESKLKIDYKEYRPIGHELTKDEMEYITADVVIVAKALKFLMDEGFNKMTIGSNALEFYRKLVTPKAFMNTFPPPYYDEEIRPSYRGGFTFVNPEFAEKEVGHGFVLDVNSLYPSVMSASAGENLPYGEGVYYNGKYKPDKEYNLFIQQFSCCFELKKNHIPCLQLKNNLSFKPTEYATTSKGEDVVLCMTSVDLNLFFNQYDVTNLHYIGGYKFRSSTTLFSEYVGYWSNVKITAKKEKNHAMYLISKLFLNSLYGKFATNPKTGSKMPFSDNGIIKYTLLGEEEKDVIYLPVGTFITAWARYKTITSAQMIEDKFYSGESDIRFLYADTDSLHCSSPSGLLPDYLEIDNYKLGAWKVETEFTKAKFLRAKTYVEYGHEYGENEPDTLNITCAGMPKSVYEFVTFDNFVVGAEYTGKLAPKHVVGGIVLEDTTFTIR